MEWAANTDVVDDWMKIDGPESASVFAAALSGAWRDDFGRNAIGAALLDGKRLIETMRSMAGAKTSTTLEIAQIAFLARL